MINSFIFIKKYFYKLIKFLQKKYRCYNLFILNKFKM